MKVLSAKGRFTRAVFIFVVGFVAQISSLARIISVPGDAATIQDGVNLAASGDTVLVKPGVYHEFVILNGRLITLKCDGPAFSAIIEPPSDKAAVTCMSGESSLAIIAGFTFRNCAIGANILNSAPVIQANYITNCATGIYSVGSGLYLTNEIAGCALGVFLQGSAIVRGNTIHNGAKGIHVDSGDPLIRENLIFANSDTGVEIAAGNSTVLQNLIYDNRRLGVGWTVPQGGRGPSLIHNTIAAPSNIPATQATGFAAGSLLANNIIVGDPAFQLDVNTQAPAFDHNLFFSAAGSPFFNLPAPADGGNIVGDPQFVAPSTGDYEIGTNSPAIDAAHPAQSVQIDIIGNTRPVDGNADSFAAPDIGAYEFVPGFLRPPFNFIAAAFVDRVELSWQAIDPSAQFVIKRSTNSAGPFVPIISTSGTTATDKAITPRTTYYYVIATKQNDASESKPSPVVSVRPGNHPPTSFSNSAETLEDTPLLFSLPSLTDDDGDALTITRLLSSAGGQFTITNQTQIQYLPPPDFSGSASVQYEVTDGFDAFATNSLSITVKSVDDAPVWNDQFAYQIPANVATVITPVVSDIDSTNFQFRITRQPTNAYVMVQGLRFIYRPIRGFSGADSFVAVASDGQLDSLGATFAITVLQPPDVDNDNIPDAWENFWDVNNPNADPDQDGLTNLQEFIANTSPHDAASAVNVSRLAQTSDGFLKVTWPAIGGVRYRVFSADQLTGHASDFLPLVQDVGLEMELAPDGAIVDRTFVDTRPLTTNQRFYRVEAIGSTAMPLSLVPVVPPFGGVVVVVGNPPSWTNTNGQGEVAPPPAPPLITGPNHL